jgi:hypothetical protein
MVHLWYGQRRITIKDLPDCPLMNAEDLGWILGLSPQRIRQMAEVGLPRVAPGHYPLYGCLRWYIRFLKSCGFVRKRSKSKEKYRNLRVKILQIELQQITGKFIEQELIEARRYLVRNLDRHLSGLPWAIGRELGLTKEQTLNVRTHLDNARNALVGDNDRFISERLPDWWPDRKR